MQTMQKQQGRMSPEDLANLGGGVVAYVRKIGTGKAAELLGGKAALPDGADLFCLYNANGVPISISQSYEAAVGNAVEHELVAASVH